MTLADAQSLVEIAGTTIGILGGLFGLYKYVTDKRENELREWQKVVIYKIFRQNQQLSSLSFMDIREKYLREAQTFVDINLTKKEIGDDALRRILLELTSSSILSMGPLDSFRLNAPPDPNLLDRANQELAKMIAPDPFVYTVDQVAREIAPKVGQEVPIFRTSLLQSVAMGAFVLDEKGRIAFARER